MHAINTAWALIFMIITTMKRMPCILTSGVIQPRQEWWLIAPVNVEKILVSLMLALTLLALPFPPRILRNWSSLPSFVVCSWLMGKSCCKSTFVLVINLQCMVREPTSVFVISTITVSVLAFYGILILHGVEIICKNIMLETEEADTLL